MESDLISIIATVGGSSGLIGIIIKISIKKLMAEWHELSTAIKAISTEIQDIKLKMAVHEALAADHKQTKTELDQLKKDIIILQQQVNAAWRVLDNPRKSDK